MRHEREPDAQWRARKDPTMDISPELEAQRRRWGAECVRTVYMLNSLPIKCAKPATAFCGECGLPRCLEHANEPHRCAVPPSEAERAYRATVDALREALCWVGDGAPTVEEIRARAKEWVLGELDERDRTLQAELEKAQRERDEAIAGWNVNVAEADRLRGELARARENLAVLATAAEPLVNHPGFAPADAARLDRLEARRRVLARAWWAIREELPL